jgi:hypothetical protein
VHTTYHVESITLLGGAPRGPVARPLLSWSTMGPATPVVTSREGAVLDAVIRWSEQFIEQPHEVFGGLPVCPFARAARLKQTIRFEIRPFALDDPLELDGDIMGLVREFADQVASGTLRGSPPTCHCHPIESTRLIIEAFRSHATSPPFSISSVVATALASSSASTNLTGRLASHGLQSYRCAGSVEAPPPIRAIPGWSRQISAVKLVGTKRNRSECCGGIR